MVTVHSGHLTTTFTQFHELSFSIFQVLLSSVASLARFLFCCAFSPILILMFCLFLFIYSCFYGITPSSISVNLFNKWLILFQNLLSLFPYYACFLAALLSQTVLYIYLSFYFFQGSKFGAYFYADFLSTFLYIFLI